MLPSALEVRASNSGPGGHPQPAPRPPESESESRAGTTRGTPRDATATKVAAEVAPAPANGTRKETKWAQATGGAMKLQDLPADLHKSFQHYTKDDNKDEIDYAKLPVTCPDRGMPLQAYPEAMRDAIKAFDVNGDGYVEMHELARAAELYKDSKNQSRRLSLLVVMLVAIIGVLVGVTAACTYAVVEAAKETEVSGDGEMHVKGKSNVVATTGVAEKTEDIFDFVTKDEVDVGGVKTLTLVTGATKRQYTVTGYEQKLGELSFFTATGHKVTVTRDMYSIYNANGSTLATVTKASSRRRSLLAAGGGSTVTTGVSSGGSTASSLSVFNPSDFESTMTTVFVVHVNDVMQTSGTLVAMVGADIRGYASSPLTPPFGPYAGSSMFFTTIYANDGAEDFSFKFIDDSGAEHDMVLSSDGASWDGKFKSNDSAGNVLSPVVLKSVPSSPYASYSDKMTLVAFLMLGTPSDIYIFSGKFRAYSMEDGSLRGESTAPAVLWFGMFPVWSIEIHGSKDREPIELRFEKEDGTTFILNEKEIFRAGNSQGTLTPIISPRIRRVKLPTNIAPPPPPVAPAMPKPTLPIDMTQFSMDATAMVNVEIDGMTMTDGMVVAYDGTTPVGGSDKIMQDPLKHWIAMFNIGGYASTKGKQLTFWFWGNPNTCTDCEALDLEVAGAMPAFEQNVAYGRVGSPLRLLGSSDRNFNVKDFEHSMSLYAKVKIDGTFVTSGKLTAYDGNRVIGMQAAPSTPAYRQAVNRPVPAIPGVPDGFYEFMIYNDATLVEGIKFKYTKTDGTVIDLEGSVTFKLQSTEYSLVNMVELSN